MRMKKSTLVLTVLLVMGSTAASAEKPICPCFDLITLAQLEAEFGFGEFFFCETHPVGTPTQTRSRIVNAGPHGHSDWEAMGSIGHGVAEDNFCFASAVPPLPDFTPISTVEAITCMQVINNFCKSLD